jgi:putative membrane protein
MKKLSIAFLSLTTYCLMQSCNSDSSTNTSSTTSDSSTTTTNDTTGAQMNDTANRMADTSAGRNTSSMNAQPLDKDATDFVNKAASGGLMEVELGRVAQEKAKNQRVKDFGSMMVSDHTQANDELKSIASSKNVTVPAAVMPDEQKHIDELNKKTGADFDKAYMNMMLEDHKKDVAEFKKTSEKSTDADIKNFAAKTLPVLQKHLDSAKAIHGSKM